MKRFLSVHLLMLSTALSLCASAAEQGAETPAVTDESVVKLIEKSNVVPGYKISGRLQNDEALISTYRNLESKKEGLDNDCKIDATLIAKELMLSNNLGIKRVRVHFHEPTLSGILREVVVTLPEVKALAAGAVTQEEYMDSVVINKLSEKPDKAVEVVQSPVKSPAAITTTAPTGASTPESSSVKPKRQVFQTHGGITFEIPDGWSVDPKSSSEVLATLTSRLTRQDNIILRIVRSADTPAKLAAMKRKEFTYSGVSFERYESTRFGKGGYEGALISIIYPHESNTPYYDIHLYFGKPPRVYELYAWSSMTNSRTVKQGYADLMTTLAFPGARSGGAPGAAKSSANRAAKK